MQQFIACFAKYTKKVLNGKREVRVTQMHMKNNTTCDIQ